ncbi:MarR family transcriptional regulator [Kitasatospora sp. NPDC058190]|uniref:MarR family transcriptional regulator n=1 Tax=Kitasatospora sp. NPDC058190 TaxID=3346371 RepID=UPI0036DB81DD
MTTPTATPTATATPTPTATATATAPAPLSPRAIALAHYAGRSLLEGVLARHGATFEQSVTLRAVTAAGGSLGREELLADITGSLKADRERVRALIEETTAAGLLEAGPWYGAALRLTGAGRELHERTSAEIAPVSARLYAGIPAQDLAVAGRVLALITERADAELARA